jgi:hypothetical protein
MGQRTLLGAALGYGGAGTLRLGLQARTRIGGRTWLEVGTPQVAGFMLGGTRGLGLLVGLRVEL